MADYTFKTTDTRPLIAETCAFSDGTIQDLTAATVTFAMWPAGTRGTPTINDASMTIVDAPGGKVAYTLQSNDLANAGVYHAEIHVVDSGGGKTTFPNSGRILIVVESRNVT